MKIPTCPLFRCFILGSGSTWPLSPYQLQYCSAYLHGGQRQMVTDYWQTRNAFIDSSHANVFVSAGTKHFTKLVTRNTFSFGFLCFFSLAVRVVKKHYGKNLICGDRTQFKTNLKMYKSKTTVPSEAQGAPHQNQFEKLVI